jgi:SOS-response transcriptional repressor LexA
MPESLAEELRRILEERDLSLTELAKQVGVSRAAVSNWVNDANGPKYENILKVMRALKLVRLGRFVAPQDNGQPGTPSQEFDEPEPTKKVRVRGYISAGAWLELDAIQDADLGTVNVVPDPRYGRAAQYALRVVGTSMNKIAQPGDSIIVADWAELGREIKAGDLLVVRRQDGERFETTLKRAKRGREVGGNCGPKAPIHAGRRRSFSASRGAMTWR